MTPDNPTLTTPRAGVPDLVGDDTGLLTLLPRLAADPGPLAVDTERASGYRYFQRAYLVQFKTQTSGIHLIDPTGLSPAVLAGLASVVNPKQWVLHAASQDLPCLRDLGLSPHRLFDTELAGRLLGYPRVGLGPLVETTLGLTLAKDHGNSDWSIRPLPADWLGYAALDVELLIDLMTVLAAELADQSKTDWADQEFAHALTQSPTPRPDRWRHISDIHVVTSRRGLALVQAIWQVRDAIAQELDLSPHRVVNDRAIAAVGAQLKPGAAPDLTRSLTSGGFAGPVARVYRDRWLAAAAAVTRAPVGELPSLRAAPTTPRPGRSWPRTSPAGQRWSLIRPLIEALATSLNLPVENLISPQPLAAVLWQPAGLDPASLDAQMADLDVRAWQRQLVVPVIAAALDPSSRRA